METTPSGTPTPPIARPASCSTALPTNGRCSSSGLLGKGPTRFNQLRRQVDGLSQKVLTKVLRGLEADGLVSRTVFPTVPVTVEYALTPLGKSLSKTLDPVRHWAEDNIEAILEARQH